MAPRCVRGSFWNCSMESCRSLSKTKLSCGNSGVSQRPVASCYGALRRRVSVQPIPREARADQARLYIQSRFTSKQQLFLDFVLQHYVTLGVEELARDKLTPLPQLRY